MISLVLDLTIAIYKLVAKLTAAQDKALTLLEIVLTFLFAPIAFPVADFDYDDCIATGLSDSIMDDLSTYATLGLTMLIWMIVILACMVLIKVVCKKDKEGSAKLLKIGLIVLFVFIVLYGILALLFLVLAFLGTVESLATGAVTGFSGIVEGVELYVAFRETQDVSNKVGLSG